MLAHDVNTGYQDLGNIQLLSVNGVRVRNLGHAAALISGCSDKYVRLELEWSKVRRATCAARAWGGAGRLQGGCTCVRWRSARRVRARARPHARLHARA